MDCVTAAEHSPQKLKILLLITSTAGGVGRHTYLLAQHLPRDAFDLTIGYGPGYPLDQPVEGLGVRVIHLSLSRGLSPSTNLRGAVQVYRFLKRERFDVVCTGCSIAGLIGRVTGYLVGVPQRVHVAHVFASQPNQPAVARALYLRLERWLDRLTTHYVAVCEASKTFGVRSAIMPFDKVTVIHNGIDTRTTDLGPVNEAFAASIGISLQRPVVGTAGRLELQKGVRYLIEAFPQVLSVLPDAQLLIAGDGPLKENLVQLAESLGISDHVRFIGWREDVNRVLKCMDVFCLPSLYEMFPYSLLEALSMQRPVVAAAVDGVPEIIIDRHSGLLVPARDSPALAGAILRCLEEPSAARRMAQAGRELVEAEFSVDSMARQYADLFRALAAPSSHSAK